MSDLGFKLMVCIYRAADLFYAPEKRINSFRIEQGITVLDYGCGPGRYLKGLSNAVGKKGKVYAADIHHLALHYSKRRIEKHGLENVELVLVRDYHCDIANNSVDIVCALDMLHQVSEPKMFFEELHRVIRKDGKLILDDGHQKRDLTKREIDESGLWRIIEESKDHLKCSPE